MASLGYALVAVIIGFVFTGINSNTAKIANLDNQVTRLEDDLLARIDKMEQEFEADIASLEVEIDQRFAGLDGSLTAEIDRLDESNRNRRNQIADIQVNVASNVQAIEELRRDVERLIPAGSDSP